ncbi:endolytic transglycosylase MltG [Candidatus Nomurabacteria bacterium]|nr:endolytic transglycosylase MltG [Candidatus Nomurabacteria bacterium]
MRTFSRHLRYFLVLVIAFSLFYSYDQSKPEQIVVVPHGLDSRSVVDDLNNRGYISNKISYWSLVLMTKLGKEIVPGAYSLKKGMGALALEAEISNPEYRYVTIQEGLRLEEIAEVFAKELDWSDNKKAEFIKTFPLCPLTSGEGFLFPGTYLVHKDEPVKIIKEEMKENLIKHVSEMLQEPDENVLNISQVVNIASLIQREAAGKSDMRLISGIIWNRLFNDMPLQIDATLQYIKGNEEVWWPRVKSDDKYLESPYNTYKNIGLPPGPISNPGKSAIAAALDPTDTSCIFYLHDKNKNIHCSTTYDRHKQNVSYYLK